MNTANKHWLGTQELYYRAEKAYMKYCRRHGFVYMQPCESCTDYIDQTVILQNVTGELYKYHWRVDEPVR